MKNLKFIFIADFFSNEVPGGGELCNEVLILELLKKGHELVKIRSHEVSIELLEHLKDYNIIIANFVNLKKEVIQHISSFRKYVIYEHDHKYLKTRDPSFFPDFQAPKSEVIHESFYDNAIAIFAQSKFHQVVIQKHLKNSNVVNLGCSLWSDEQFQILEEYSKIVPIDEVYAVLDSNIPHKGTKSAIEYCEKVYNYYNVIKFQEFSGYIRELSHCSKLVFFPQTAETLSRVVVEAKMLNRGVITTPSNIGASSEPWIKLKGLELIQKMKELKKLTINKVISTFQNENKLTVTAILNVYRRPHNLFEQIKILKEQTYKVDQIFVWVNKFEGVNLDVLKELPKDVKVFHCDHNWKFYGRYTAALLAKTSHILILDDDTNPGIRYVETCVKSYNRKPGVYGSAGVILACKNYNPHIRKGWPSKSETCERVDLVGHSVFFPKSVVNALWSEEPSTFENGEDIQLSYCAQKYLNLDTFVTPHPENDLEIWGSLKGEELGIDEAATSNGVNVSHQQFFKERDEVILHCLRNNWKTVNNVKV